MRPVRLTCLASCIASLSVQLSGCKQDSDPRLEFATVAGEQIVYEHHFSRGSGGWETVRYSDVMLANARSCATTDTDQFSCTTPVILTDESMRIESPWMLDANHASPGAGNLALLGWVYLDGRYGSPTQKVRTLDLRDATLRVEMRKEALDVKDGHLYLWVQSEMPDGMYVNLAYTAQPLDTLIDAGGAWSPLEVLLAADATAWTCLGSSAARADTYRCDDVLKVASNVNFDFGFIILPVADVPDPAVQPSGAIEVRNLEISTPIRLPQ